ncbi:Phytocyanin domain [Dillenia turbinata]|uniref:Phytocyanin domain n=1 Tax=Dillenia turbinata TaxID=194707 RepID=A0AAN8W9H9_9MAGN
MASKQIAAFLTMVAVVLPSLAMATEYIVGDASGWTILYDYQAWAEDKVFHVGDKLVFQYPVGVHNVFKVDGAAFANCTVPPPDQALTSGNDTITLGSPGNKWYICGVGQHCSQFGQKLAITVEGLSPEPAPAPISSPEKPRKWKF